MPTIWPNPDTASPEAIYPKTPNEDFSSDPLSADDDKAKALMNELDGYQFKVDNNQGVFRLEVFPYWFIRENGQIRLPGQASPNFNFPANGFLKRGEEYGRTEVFSSTKTGSWLWLETASPSPPKDLRRPLSMGIGFTCP